MRSTRIYGVLSLHQSKYIDIGSHMRIANTTLEGHLCKIHWFSQPIEESSKGYVLEIFPLGRLGSAET